MGRDILLKTGATILCGPLGVTVRFPNGMEFECNHQLFCGQDGLWLVQTESPPDHADSYWCALLPEDTSGQGVFSAYMLWNPWIASIQDCDPPIDPLHSTLYYDRKGNEVYVEESRSIEGS